MSNYSINAPDVPAFMTADREKARILAIDDDKLILHLIDHILSDRFQIFTATSGAEGLNYLKQTKAELILLDVQMPGMDGFTTLRKIR